MKKYFYFLASVLAFALVVVSCGDDDGLPTSASRVVPYYEDGRSSNPESYLPQNSTYFYLDNVGYKIKDGYIAVRGYSEGNNSDDICVASKISINGKLFDVTRLDDRCFYFFKLKSLIVPSTIKSIGDKCFENCYFLGKATINAPISNLGKGCFSECQKLESVTLPSTLTVLDDSCFYDCSLTWINIPA